MLAGKLLTVFPALSIFVEILLALLAVPSVSASITNRDLHPNVALENLAYRSSIKKAALISRTATGVFVK